MIYYYKSQLSKDKPSLSHSSIFKTNMKSGIQDEYNNVTEPIIHL